MKLYPIICLIIVLATQVSAKTHKKKVRNHSHHRKLRFPQNHLPVQEKVPHFTSILETETRHGQYRMREFEHIFQKRQLRSFEIKKLFEQIDINKDNIVTDTEWSEFYLNFIEPFQSCDTDENFLLSPAELTACLSKEDEQYFRFISFALKEESDLELLRFLMDSNDVNLFQYLYMRRLNHAWDTCASGTLPAHLIQCAVSITNPRSVALNSQEEKGFFQGAIILSDGVYMGQTTRLDIFQFTRVSYIFDYFSDLEVRFSEKISKDNITRALQEDHFPSWFTKQNLDRIFQYRGAKSMNFMSFMSNYYSCKLFAEYGEGNFMGLEKFNEMMDSRKVPERLKLYVEKTSVPSEEEIELASKQVHSHNTDNDYFKNYNNLMFLEKSSKIQKKKKKQDPINLDQMASAAEFPDNGKHIVLKIFDRFKNDTIFIQYFLDFMAISYNFTQQIKIPIQRYNFDVVKAKSIPESSLFNVFSWNDKQTRLEIMLDDMITEKQEIQINYKEYLIWFTLEDAMNEMKDQALQARVSIKNFVQIFQDMGLRMSKYNRYHNLRGIDTKLNQRHEMIIQAVIAAVQEDSVAYWQKLNSGKFYKHMDLAPGEELPAF